MSGLVGRWCLVSGECLYFCVLGGGEGVLGAFGWVVGKLRTFWCLELNPKTD